MLFRSLLTLILGLGMTFSALASTPKVLTTIKPLQQIAAAVMDGVDEPGLLLSPGASPHKYALRPSDRQALLQAERIYWVGPELERFLQEILARQDNDRSLLHLPQMTVRAQLQSLNFQHQSNSRKHGHEHGHDHQHEDGALDAHIWLSPENAVQIAQFMAEDLAALYPEQQQQLLDNSAAFAERLAALDAQIKQRLQPLSEKAYFVFHDGYGYYEDHYGVRPRGIFSLSHEVQPGARHVNLLRQQLQAAQPSCVFSEPQFTPRLINSLTQGLRVEQGELDPLGGDTPVSAKGYEQALLALTENLANCLEKL